MGSGDTVISQVPAEGSTVTKENGRIILYTGEESAKATITVPDVEGKTGEAAMRILVNAGLNVRIRGAKDSQSATVISQSVEAGTKVARGTVIEISIVHTDITDG